MKERGIKRVLKSEMKSQSPALSPLAAPPGVNTRVLLTVQEVALLLKVPVSWVYEHTRTHSADRIPGFRLGKYWRFRGSDVLDWLERQTGN